MARKIEARIGNFDIVFTNERILPVTGLALVGRFIDESQLERRVDMLKLDKRPEPKIKNSDVLKTYMGLLTQGRTDYECVRELQEDAAFSQEALGLSGRLPCEATLRQRMDQIGDKLRSPILRCNADMFTVGKIRPTANRQGYVPLDVDVSPFDNSGTKKEGVSRTYKGCDGYAPIFAYVGTEGYLANCELREGKQHCQKGTSDFLWESIHCAQAIAGTDAKLLLRMDAGNDSAENYGVCTDVGIAYLVKRNLRREKPETWQLGALIMQCYDKETVHVMHPREGKTVYRGSIDRILAVPHANGRTTEERVRVVYEVIERSVLANGQMLLMPDLEVNTWHTSLSLPEDDVIALYHAHAECEQYHSELKTDMGMERLPSGKFATNALVLELAMLAYNLLRMMGQEALRYPGTPARHVVRRKRIRTVIEHLMRIAAHLTTHARRRCLGLGRSNAWRQAFAYVCRQFA